MTLPDTLIPQASALLLPHMASADEREAWLTQAFYITERRLYSQIDRGGVPIVFVTRLVKTLLDFGCLGNGNHSLSLLLSAVKLASTPSVQTEIDKLIPTLDGLCAEFIPPTTGSPIEALTLPVQTLATPANQRTPTVFISYSRRDETFARKLMNDLQSAGHACWIDTTEIKGGDEWVRAITEGINNSYAFISIISEAANESKWVRREYLWADNKGKLILPILSGATSLPIYMIDRHAITLHPDYAKGLQALITALPKPTIVQSDQIGTISNAIVNQRALELEYLDRLRLEELLNTERYTPMAGTAQVAPKRDSVQSVTIRPEFEHLRGKF